MFETFLNAFFIAIMVSVNCDNPIVIREDRVYRYVGNGSDPVLHSYQNYGMNEDKEFNETHQSIINEEVMLLI